MSACNGTHQWTGTLTEFCACHACQHVRHALGNAWFMFGVGFGRGRRQTSLRVMHVRFLHIYSVMRRSYWARVAGGPRSRRAAVSSRCGAAVILMPRRRSPCRRGSVPGCFRQTVPGVPSQYWFLCRVTGPEAGVTRRHMWTRTVTYPQPNSQSDLLDVVGCKCVGEARGARAHLGEPLLDGP